MQPAVLKSADDMGYLVLATLLKNTYHIESKGRLGGLLFQKIQRDSSNLLLFAAIDRFEGLSKGILTPCLDLYEDNGRTISCNNIHLTHWRPVITVKNRVAFLLKVGDGNFFPFSAYGVKGLFHCRSMPS